MAIAVPIEIFELLEQKIGREEAKEVIKAIEASPGDWKSRQRLQNLPSQVGSQSAQVDFAQRWLPPPVGAVSNRQQPSA